jgi:hypothetical protein
MPSKSDTLAKQLLENPGSVLPEEAMRHVQKAQEELGKAMAAIAKYADPAFLEKNPEEFRKFAARLAPAASSTADFQQTIAKRIGAELNRIDKTKATAVKVDEQRLSKLPPGVSEKDINELRGAVLSKVRTMIEQGMKVGPGGGAAAVPAAVAAGAAVVAAAVEVVTLVRSVTSSVLVDRVIKTQRLNPKLLALQRKQLVGK